ADISVGIMVETPAAVVMAETLAKYVDFFSIGTNDLCQYTLAVDRGNPKLAERYKPFHPAVLRSIKKVIDAAHGQGKLAAMCGEMAGDARAVRLLLGMGLDEFSMTAVCIPSAKEIVMNTDTAKAKLLAEKALTMETTEEVLALLESNV
ncbi:MAG: putative PEP-binding protein, partial [Oscillospiraceae bacterium]|nr:putative PEP-binding protein [Oscillospiraceae bacterium]